MKNTNLSSQQLSEIIEWITDRFQHANDFIKQPLHTKNKEMTLIYIKSVVDGDILQKNIIKPFFEMGNMEDIECYLTSLPTQQQLQTKEELEQAITKGTVLIVLPTSFYTFDIKKVHTNQLLDSNNEPTILGPQYALSEDIEVNLNVIRHRYHQPNLAVEFHNVGNQVNQSLAILYDSERVDKQALHIIKERLHKLNHDVIQSTSELQIFLNEKQRTLVPTLMVTERTDRIIYNIAGGKIALLLDGSSVCVLAPAVFFDFMTSMEDNYHPYWIVKFLKVLRYIGLLTCLIFPALYVAVTSYNPDVFRPDLALSIAGSRIGIPYPSFVEVFFMLTVMELLTEASIRLPKAISATATTVGGLILGTAATEAALTSNIMIIIVSAVAISTFVIPINDMSFAIRVFRYAILLFTTIAGTPGLILGLIGFIMYLTNIESFGQPFLNLFLQSKADEVRGTGQ